MRMHRAIALTSAVISIFGFAASGQQEQPKPDTPQSKLEKCRTDMPGIMKNYNNAKYAVFLSRQGGDQIGNLLINAQVALDAMERPLKGCYEAFQNAKDAAPPEHSN